MVVPVVLGSGERFFRDRRHPTTLSLTGVTTTGTGVVVLSYERPATDGDPSTAEDGLSGDWWLNRRQIENKRR